MIKATFDSNGLPVAFYPSDVWRPSAIPAGAVKITDEQYREFIENPGLRRFSNGAVETYQPSFDHAGYIARKRRETEEGGITWNGVRVRTDRESQSMISAAFSYVKATQRHIVFKAEDQFVTLQPESLESLALAVAAHVQLCFQVEANLHALAAPSKSDIDAAFDLVKG